MRVLGIDTATSTASVGLNDDGRVLAERSAIGKSHAAAILPLIEAVLRDAGVGVAELELIAVSIGPGSFTGLRIGLSVAKGLALATGCPLVGIPTLEALARAAGPQSGVVCSLLDARKSEVYAASFAWQSDVLTTVRPAEVVTPAFLTSILRPPCTLVGEGVDVHAAFWRSHFGERAKLVPAASLPPIGPIVARLGAERAGTASPADLAALEPAYVRKPEAELGRNSDGSPQRPRKIDRVGGLG